MAKHHQKKTRYQKDMGEDVNLLYAFKAEANITTLC
jgi:hypothetical protein